MNPPSSLRSQVFSFQSPLPSEGFLSISAELEFAAVQKILSRVPRPLGFGMLGVETPSVLQTADSSSFP